MAESGATFGEILGSRDLITKPSTATRELIRRAETFVNDAAPRLGLVVSCHGCAAPKGCCRQTTIAFLYESVPIAGRVIREGRNTPDMRHRLRVLAEEMEQVSPSQYNRPCAFLSDDDRCTVYEDRPIACGGLFVTSPPAHCSDRTVGTQRLAHPFEPVTLQLERTFEQEAGLLPLQGPYMGALPRMVLLCLQAWERDDYPAFLARHVAATAKSYFAATER